jgi:uncharacterized metal-binding protein YceD (DUF177 family)
MTPESVGPLSRPVPVERLPAEGTEVSVVATAEECDALARDFKLAAIRSLQGLYRLAAGPQRVRVSGRLRADITQVCVVTLEPFDSVIEEEVDVAFAEADARARPEGETVADPPDEIVGGRIDLGALTAEFLALGLDPYPRKPGVAFEAPPAAAPDESPFAALKRLKSES